MRLAPLHANTFLVRGPVSDHPTADELISCESEITAHTPVQLMGPGLREGAAPARLSTQLAPGPRMSGMGRAYAEDRGAGISAAGDVRYWLIAGIGLAGFNAVGSVAERLNNAAACVGSRGFGLVCWR